MDFIKSFPIEIMLAAKNYPWNRALNYKQGASQFTSCFELGYIAIYHPKISKEGKPMTWCMGETTYHCLIGK